jgi:hypothetical protein
MLRVTDASGTSVEISARGVRVGAAEGDAGTLLAVDTVVRVAEVMGARAQAVDVVGVPELNVRPSTSSGPADVVLHRPGGVADPPYGLEHRLAWLAGASVDEAREELQDWRRLVAGWAEEPSRPMCAQVQEDVLSALADDLGTRRAVESLRGSLALDLPAGCLFETWVWVDRLLALDLAAEVGR